MPGIKTMVTCPKCGKSFEYEFIPGASATAIRLGSSRYMKCKMCGRWALFDISGQLPASKQRNLGGSVIVAGIAIAVLGAAMVITAIAKDMQVLEFTGAAVIVIAILTALLGFSALRRK